MVAASVRSSAAADLEPEVRRRLVRHFGHDCGLRVERLGRGAAVSLTLPCAETRRAVA